MPAASLSTFALPDMIRLGAAVRQCGHSAASTEEAAQNVVRRLHETFLDADGEPECVLVRYYQTIPFGELPTPLGDLATARLVGTPWPGLPCLTLLATVGTEPAWNSRHTSSAHRVIPLPSEAVVAESPMIAQLISQFGLELTALIEPDPDVLVDLDQKQYNVFHVPVALGSPLIPAQEDFVVPYGVSSALGFGGMLPSGDMFAVVLFSRVPITRETADLFRTVALSVKVGVLPTLGHPFDDAG